MEFRLPALGEGIESATVTAVLVKPGDAVSAGKHVLAVETDKAAMEVEADAAGTVEQVHVKPGDKVPVGAKVLTLSGAAAPASGGRQPPEKTTQPQPTASPSGGSRPEPRAPLAKPTGNGAPRKEKELVPAGPATRRLARELGVALAEVPGTGRGGRVTIDDVKGFVRSERERVKSGG